MKGNLPFDFLVDKENNTITIMREFAAHRGLVWDCYTKSELLDQWFAPKPFITKTSSMDFKEGGHWLYAMIDPNGTEYWGRTDYLSIKPVESYTALDGFCDSNGTLNPDLPRADWGVVFSDLNNHTLVHITVTYKSLNDLETVIKMGLQEGLTMTLEHLDELLETLKK
jgi:uncharacterized protein YndB with AHSA1/START domain